MWTETPDRAFAFEIHHAAEEPPAPAPMTATLWPTTSEETVRDAAG